MNPNQQACPDNFALPEPEAKEDLPQELPSGLVRVAGGWIYDLPAGTSFTPKQVRELLAAERERCAEVCERLGTLKSASAEECAAAIRGAA